MSSASFKVTPITLTEYNTQYGADPVAPLYVLNRTVPRGDIAFNCQNDMGQTVPVIIPATFIPIDLTTLVPRENLIKSSFFRGILQKNSLVIIDNKAAENFLSTNSNARREYGRLNKMTEEQLKAAYVDLGEESAARSSAPRLENESLSTNNFVNALIERAAGGEDSDDNLEREFLSKYDTLSRADLEVLRANISHPALVSLIIDAIEDLA
ncbi:hypothetical protein fHeYen902_125 [Yersinia phage fHe-Yen9-02]|nr:hypothetical protein fHeYen902_125 [Yersinia phage fHe-Yen9-02]